MTRQVLGIAGKKGSGKTTLARELEQRGWIRMAFADEVKELALTLDPYVAVIWRNEEMRRLSDEVRAEGWDEAKKDPEVRRILQVVGTELGRAFDPNIWVNRLANRIYRTPADARIVIDDVRFINECNFIRHTLHGAVVRLPGGLEGDNHPSETEVGRLDPTLDVVTWELDGTPAKYVSVDGVLGLLGWGS